MIGERLKELRKDKGWTQLELAERLNVSVSAVKSYEQDVHDPGDETTVAIAQLFNISLDYLLGAIDEEVPLVHKNYLALPKTLSKESIADLKKYIHLLELYDNEQRKQ